MGTSHDLPSISALKLHVVTNLLTLGVFHLQPDLLLLYSLLEVLGRLVSHGVAVGLTGRGRGGVDTGSLRGGLGAVAIFLDDGHPELTTLFNDGVFVFRFRLNV